MVVVSRQMGGPRLTPEQKLIKREERKRLARELYQEKRKDPGFRRLLAERQRKAYHAQILVKRQKKKERRERKIEQYRKTAREAYRREIASPIGKMRRALRRGIQRMVESGGAKNGSSIYLLGADFIVIRQYIESLWAFGMSWENYGRWHIDHIRPLSSFNLADPLEMKQAAHYTNLQPVWGNINLSWGSKR